MSVIFDQILRIVYRTETSRIELAVCCTRTDDAARDCHNKFSLMRRHL